MNDTHPTNQPATPAPPSSSPRSSSPPVDIAAQGPAATWRRALGPAAALFVVVNVVSGLVIYDPLMFDVLNRPTGTGGIPGPWLVVPFLALALFPAALILGLVVRFGSGRRADLLTAMLAAFVLLSIAFHVIVTLTILGDADFWRLD